jgi:hypothetical protein
MVGRIDRARLDWNRINGKQRVADDTLLSNEGFSNNCRQDEMT